MRIGLVLPGLTESNLKLAKQMGVTDVVSGVPAEARNDPAQEFRALLKLKQQVYDACQGWGTGYQL